MTNASIAQAMRRLAACIEGLPADYRPGDPPMLNGEQAFGAAVLLSYLRSLFTATPKEVFRRDEILVILTSTGRDPEIFQGDTLSLLDMIDSSEHERG